MARVLKKPGLPVAEARLVEVVIPPPEPKPEPQGQPSPGRRRLKSTEHPAVDQFSNPEAKARVREALAVNPNLLPTAFSHRPGREGCTLTALEADRVLSGKSIHISGFGFEVDSRAGDSMCLKCYLSQGCPSQVPGKGFTIALFESKTVNRTCMHCGTKFKGER
jgi:hypothetical protein